MKIISKDFFLKLIAEEKEQLIIWVPVFFGAGIIFFFSYSGSSSNFIAPILLFICAIILALIYRHYHRFVIFFTIGIFLFGYLWGFFYDKYIAANNQINGIIYVDVIGKVKDLRIYHNPVTKRPAANLIIGDLIFYKPNYSAHKASKVKIKKTSKKSVHKKSYKIKSNKKHPSPSLKHPSPSLKHPSPLPLSRKGRGKIKTRKITKSMVNKWLNISDLQQIDRQFLEQQKNYQNIGWLRDNSKNRLIYKDPPDNIEVNVITDFESVKIGDLIALRALLKPIKNKQIIDDFDHQLDAKAKKIGAEGFATSNLVLVKPADISSYQEMIAGFRQLIASKIASQISGDNLGIANALTIGKKNNISKSTITNIQNSGLAHLLAISGLHLSLMAGIFFTFSRLLLSFNQYLTLRFDIKKIAAAIAIFGSYFYLEISGSSVTAIRSFIIILLFFLAIILEQKPTPLISLALGATAILLFNPYYIFTISFQLSFVAVTSLVAFYQNFKNLKLFAGNNSIIAKSSNYIFQIILCSIIVEIATAPFLIYHFNNISIYGILANIAAIPIISFLTLPLGFLAIILMPFSLEKYALKLMSLTIDLVIKIASYISHLDHSYFGFLVIPKTSLILSAIGLLLICLPKEKKLLPIIGLIFLICSLLAIYFQPKPSLLIDGEAKFFAIQNQQNGIIFSKDLRPSKKRDLWLKKTGHKEFKSFKNYSKEWLLNNKINCDEQKCILEKSDFTTKKTLILLKRNRVDEICKNDFDLLINLTKKYQIPECITKDKIIIDNSDLLVRGSHFIYK
jgi:competence protein ComEC